MMQVWKFPIEPDTTILEIPETHEFLCAQTQHDEPCVWALVDPKKPKIKKTLRIFGTGHDIVEPNNLKYIGTFQILSDLVFHVWEQLEA